MRRNARRTRAARVMLLLALAGAAIPVAGPVAQAYADRAPRPKAGIVPLDLSVVARASGADLRLSEPDMTLAGKRVRFVARLDSLEALPDGRCAATFSSGDSRVALVLPAPLEEAGRLDRSRDWEVIARLLAPAALPGGRAAIAVSADALVKTPGLPSQERPDDVVARVEGASSFSDPGLPPWESEQPLYRTKVLEEGRVRSFTKPEATALAATADERGRFLEYRANLRADDGRMLAVQCRYRLVDGLLRNFAYATVEIAPSGERSNETAVDFEDDRWHDKWSAREKPFPANTYATSCLFPALSGFPVGGRRVVRFHAWGDNRMPVPLYAYLDGEETLDVRGRPEAALRVRVGLDVREAGRSIDVPDAFRDLAEAGGEVWFADESTWWIAKEPPRVVLRYRGPLGAPGSPEVQTDRVR